MALKTVEGGGLGAALGAIAGFFVGGPLGVVAGASFGFSLGSLLSQPGVDGPRLDDLSPQLPSYGAAIPRIYGKAPAYGQMIWIREGKITEVIKKSKQGGFLGIGAATVKTYTYELTAAFVIGEGEASAIEKVWIGPYLVIDSTATDLESIAASSDVDVTFYYGTSTQTADPTMEFYEGAGNVPAYRGLSYLVLKDYPLERHGNNAASAVVKVQYVSNANLNADASRLNRETTDSHSDGSYLRSNYAHQDINGTHRFSVVESDWYSTNVRGVTHELVDWAGVFHKVRTYVNPFFASGFRTPYGTTGGSTAGEGHVPQGAADEPMQLFVGRDGDAIWFALLGVEVGANLPDTEEELATYTYDSLSTAHYGPFNMGRFDSTNCTAIKWCIRDSLLYVLVQSIDNHLIVQKYEISKYDLLLVDSGVITSVANTALQIGFFLGELIINDGLFIYKLDQDTLQITSTVDQSALWGIPANLTSIALSSFDNKAFYIYHFNNIGLLYKAVDYSGTLTHVATDSSLGFGSTNSRPYSKIYSDKGPMRVVIRYTTASSYNRIDTFGSPTLAETAVTLGALISAEVGKSDLIESSDIDVSALTETVTGFVVAKQSKIRSVLEPLRSLYPFDVVSSGYQIKFVPRGGSSVATVSIDDLGKDVQWEESREMDSQLPRKVTVKFLNADREYEEDERSFERLNTDSVNIKTVDTAVVLTPDQAIQKAEILNFNAWLERRSGSFTLPMSFRAFEIADVITLELGYSTIEVLLTKVSRDQNGQLNCQCVINNSEVYTSLATTESSASSVQSLSLVGQTMVVFVDAGIVAGVAQDKHGVLVVAYGTGSGWSRGVLTRTDDGGQTWQEQQALAAGTIGIATNKLNSHSGLVIERAKTLRVSMYAGTLTSATEAEVLNGANMAAYGVPGRWEIVRFQSVTDNGGGSYSLSNWVRGDKGTEWATGLHENDDYFVLLTDPDNIFISLPAADLNSQVTYRAYPVGQDVSAGYDTAFTYTGENLKPVAVSHAAGQRDTSGNLTISFLRGERYGTEWRDGKESAVLDLPEAYEIDVLNGSTVLRTIEVSSPSASYTAAEQVTDFGSAQAAIDIKIYALSATVGRGHVLETTI